MNNEGFKGDKLTYPVGTTLWVLCNDSFMSGWGEARGVINTLIFPCVDLAQANIVADNARRRSDQKYVRIVSHAPRLRDGHFYQVKTIEDYPTWYKYGSF
jgi:hypothetical protein